MSINYISLLYLLIVKLIIFIQYIHYCIFINTLFTLFPTDQTASAKILSKQTLCFLNTFERASEDLLLCVILHPQQLQMPVKAIVVHKYINKQKSIVASN